MSLDEAKELELQVRCCAERLELARASWSVCTTRPHLQYYHQLMCAEMTSKVSVAHKNSRALKRAKYSRTSLATLYRQSWIRHCKLHPFRHKELTTLGKEPAFGSKTQRARQPAAEFQYRRRLEANKMALFWLNRELWL